jgi:hypothetical protein
MRLTQRPFWANSSAGRAPALQAGGHRFKSCFAHHREPWCSWLTHRPVKPEIAGSSPVGSAILAEIAQSVEQGTENPRVAGSIPALGTRRRAEVVQW